MATARTFDLDVDGVGTFTFRKRTLRDQFRIEAEVIRVLGGSTEDRDLRSAATAYATLLVLTEQAPDGWNLDDFDPLNEDETDQMFAAHRGLREHEIAFRAGGSSKR